MNALDMLRSVSGSDDSIERPHHPSRLPLEYDALEPRQLLSGVQATTSSETSTPQVMGATAAAGTAGIVAAPSAGTSVVTHAVGDVNSLQSQIPLNDLLANLSRVTADVFQTDTGISVASGLTSLPITALIAPTVTSNETPLNNGTPDIGTVWITPPPVPPGLFHTAITDSPLFATTWMQTANPQGGPPTFTHFGQNANASMSGAAMNQAVAVGPIGPSITEEIEPVQPPPVEAHQPAGPPVQVQQDETAPTQDAQTPPGGAPGSGESGTPGQGAVPGQPAGGGQGQQGGAGAAATPAMPATTPRTPAGQDSRGAAGNSGPPGAGNRIPGVPGPAGSTGGATGGPDRSGNGGRPVPPRPGQEGPDGHADDTVDLIDAAIPAMVANAHRDAGDRESDGPMPTVLGAAAVAAGGFHLALRGPDRLRRGLNGARPDGDPSPTR